MSEVTPPDEGQLKYPAGVGARVPPAHRPLGTLERIALGHAAGLLIGVTWAFGGQADWLRTPIAWAASLSLLISLSALQDREAWREGWMRPLLWLWPVAGFNLLVFASCLNPSFEAIQVGHEVLWGDIGANPHWPSAAQPELGLRELWLFDGLWLTAFNLVLVVRQRRALRLVLMIIVANALVLSIFGTVQKLAHAKGIYFDAIATPQVYFFASFVYHNHWGAFIVLMLAACLALVGHYARRRDARDFFHSPAFGGVIVAGLLALTVPLSTSRSCTLLVALLLAVAGVQALASSVLRRRRFRESIVLPLAGAAAAVALGGYGIWSVAQESITARIAKTQEQLAAMHAAGSIGTRATLYRDTWGMARAKPWFGWGMASYPRVFTLFNTQHAVDNLPVFYHDAHSDWLQSLAEHGWIGSALLALAVVLPLRRLRPRHHAHPVIGYLLGSCALLGAYAWVEFPFGNTAVVLSWWLLFFCAVQYARLQDREASSPRRPVPT